MSEAQGSVERDGPGDLLLDEPLQAWRMYARGLAALFDLVDLGLPRDAITPETWEWSIAAIAIPLWLMDRERMPPPITEAEVPSLMTELGLGRAIPSPNELVESALGLAGISPAYDSAPESTSMPGYTLSAVPINAAGMPGMQMWQVRGLQPILAASLSLAALTQERPRCTRCQKPAAIVTRGPRQGRPWYGDHTWCRAMARAETMIKAEDKRAKKGQRHGRGDIAGSFSDGDGAAGSHPKA
jgi:hypothetical protein